MSRGNGIAWCTSPDGSPGFSWSPVVGCTAVSPGCANCWAAAMASRALGAAHKGLAEAGRWIPGVGPRFLPETLAIPLRRQKPTGYAVCLMGDLFHPGVPDAQIEYVSDLPAGHALVTEDKGPACDYTGKPYIVDCDYDQAGALLRAEPAVALEKSPMHPVAP